MPLITCPSCDRLNDSNQTPFHIAEAFGLGRITIYHCACGEHFRDQIVAGIPVEKKVVANAEVQNP